MKPSIEERRRAIAAARRLANATDTDADIRLMALTLLAAQEAFIDRLAPVYAAALDLVRDDGTGEWSTWQAFKDVVLRCKAYERTVQRGPDLTIEPHTPEAT